MPLRSIDSAAYVPSGKRVRYESTCEEDYGDETGIKDEPLDDQSCRDALSRLPTIPWNEGDGPYIRAMLIFIKRVYIMSGPDMLEIIWAIFEHQFLRWGQHRDGQLQRKLQSQCAELIRQSGTNFTVLFIVPFESLRLLCADMEGKIVKAAAELELQLHASEQDLLDCYQYHPNWLDLFQASFPRWAGPYYIDLCQDGEDSFSRVSSSPTIAQENSRILSEARLIKSPLGGTLMSRHPSSIIYVKDDEPVPLTLFRFFDDSSHGLNSPCIHRAAKFNRPGCEVPPLLHDNTELLNAAERHLYTKEFDSPFISTTSSFIWAFHKALQKQNEVIPKEGYISCILGLSAANHTGALHVKRIIQDLRKQNCPRVKKYRAEFEWFIWGEIESASIVSTVPISKIISLSNRFPSVANFLQLDLLSEKKRLPRIISDMAIPEADIEAGYAIGKLIGLFLKDSPYKNFSRKSPLVNDLARGFLQNWRVEVNLDAWDNSNSLTDGIERGLEDMRWLRFGPPKIWTMPSTPPRQIAQNVGLLTPPGTTQQQQIIANAANRKESTVRDCETPPSSILGSPSSWFEKIQGAGDEDLEYCLTGMSDEGQGGRLDSSEPSSSVWWFDDGIPYPTSDSLSVKNEDMNIASLRQIASQDDWDPREHELWTPVEHPEGLLPATPEFSLQCGDAVSERTHGGVTSSAEHQRGSPAHDSNDSDTGKSPFQVLDLTADDPDLSKVDIYAHLDGVLEKHRQRVCELMGGVPEPGNLEMEIKPEYWSASGDLETNIIESYDSEVDFKDGELEVKLAASLAMERRGQLTLSSSATTA